MAVFTTVLSLSLSRQVEGVRILYSYQELPTKDAETLSCAGQFFFPFLYAFAFKNSLKIYKNGRVAKSVESDFYGPPGRKKLSTFLLLHPVLSLAIG